jgi:hypothetical protein
MPDLRAGELRPANIRRYVDDCQELFDDLVAVLRDLKSQQAGTRIRYAVDFCEITGYALPGTQSARLQLFHDDDPDTAVAVEIDSLTRLFHELPDEVILLPPYWVELESWLSQGPFREVSDWADMVAKAAVERERVVVERDFVKLSELVETVCASGEPLRKPEMEQALRLIRSRVPSLLRLVSGVPQGPRRRLKSLLGDRRLVPLSSLGIAPPSVDAVLAKRWSASLREMRETSMPGRDFATTSAADALAMTQVLAANRLLAGSKMAIRLVTRSRFMRRVLQPGHGLDPLPNDALEIIMHPRAFCAFRTAFTTRDVEGPTKDLEQMRDSFSVFLDAYDGRISRAQEPRDSEGVNTSIAMSRVAVENRRELVEKLNRIKRLWIDEARLAASAVRDRRLPYEGEKDDVTVQKMARVLTLLNNEKEFYQAVANEAERMSQSIDRDYEDFGVHLARLRASAEGIEGLPERLRYFVHPGKAVLESDLPWMPFTLSFGSRDVVDMIDRTAQGGSAPLSEVLSLFRDDSEAAFDFERLLAIAYVFGAWGRWASARTYARLAFRREERASDVASYVRPATFHEGQFFLAVCHRMLNDSLHYSEALDLLEEARAAKKRLRDDNQYEDPRFLSEKAAIIAAWNKRWATLAIRDLGGPPPPGEALDALRTAETWVRDDIRLKAQIHGLFCEAYLYSPDVVDEELARHHLDRLGGARLQVRGLCPAELVDIEVWTRWKLDRGTLSEPKVNELVAQLEGALQQTIIRASAKRLIGQHLREIRSASR